jgi:hypothetical protein
MTFPEKLLVGLAGWIILSLAFTGAWVLLSEWVQRRESRRRELNRERIGLR